ncbi:ParB/RepB/Spo0J family partition protein [Brevundimonas sp. MEB006b]|uniref:ParB/RepB/Spo0J family partition protein n=1 Tax=Brevundimonas sp. MEB006b TaxID=3040283 RepID=UPI00254CC5FC|nr:ParB/RepB/Spo0J family partition protein [Brevundimonas sp. MEB006b]
MTAQSTQTAPTEATAPQHGAEVIVPLNRLKASQKNARKTPHSPATIEAFAASIKAKGVLQPPVVEIERDGEGVPTGNYLVTIGEGRRQGLRLLAKRKAIKRTHPVRCIVDAENDAHEISLDENMTREAMHPADQFEAFQRLAVEKGYGPEEIGARFGVSAHVVRQRLRLGAAAPELMAAYRDGALALDQLMAFCVSADQDRQRHVFEQLGEYRPIHAIRRAMTEAKVAVGDRRVRFVGVEAYVEAGGGILRDLFTEDGGGWLEDVVLLDRLVADKLTGLADEAREREGWKWAEAGLEYPDLSAFGRVYPVAVERSEADAAEIAALSEEYDGIVSEAGDDGLSPEADARLEEIDKALQAFGPDFAYAPKARARAGVMVMLGHDGLARFERGLVRAEDVPADPPSPWPEEGAADDDAEDGTQAGADAPEGETPSALSDRLLIDLTAHKTMGLRDAVQADVNAALATGLERLAPGVDDGPAGRRVRDRCEAWGARLPERPEDLWGVVAGLAPSDQLDLMACCAGVGLYAVRDPHDRRPGALAQAETLATAVGLDMAGTWTATAASYFSRVAKPKVLEAVTEAAGAQEAARIAGFKKADMAEAAERLVEGKGWLPVPLRTVSDAAEPDGEAGEESPPPDGDAYSFAAE